MKALVIIIFSILMNISAYAQITDSNKRTAIASFLSEMSECAVFYNIISQGTDNKGNKWEGGQKFKKLSENISMMSFNLAKEINMKAETLLAMMTGYAKDMGNQINHDAINIRILTNKHGQFCKKLAESPQDRLLFWMLKESR